MSKVVIEFTRTISSALWGGVSILGGRSKNIRFIRVLLLFVVVFIFQKMAGAAQTPLTPTWGYVTAGGTGTKAATLTADGGLGTATGLGTVTGAAFDRFGNIYLADATSYVIRKIAAGTGIVTTLAGTGKTGQNGDGLGTSTQLSNVVPGIFIDRDGNLLFADENNHAIRKLYLSGPNIGYVVTVAGVLGSSGNGGSTVATSAKLNTPAGVSGDSAGNIYIADQGNHVIRKVDQNGNISTIAGTGTAGGLNAAPIAATSATLHSPWSVWVDQGGNVFILDTGNQAVRKVDAVTHMITTVAGNGTKAASAAAAGNNIPATSAELDQSHGLVGDNEGNLYISEESGMAIRMVDNAGIIHTITGTLLSAGNTTSTGVLALGAKINYPFEIHIDDANNLVFANSSSAQITKLTTNLTTSPQQTFTPVGTTSAAHNLYVMSSGAVTPQMGVITPLSPAEFTLGTFSGCTLGSQLAANTACTVPVTFTPALPGLRMAQLVVTDSTGLKSVIPVYGFGSAPEASFTAATATTIAGNGTAGSAAGEVNSPRGGVVDSAGDVYFADSANNVIRKVDTTGNVTVVAGTGTAGYAGDGTAATSATLSSPSYVAIDKSGNLYIADTGNNVVREVSSSTGLISTIAGGGTVCASASSTIGDGCPPTQAILNAPQGIAVDLGGHVYVADTGNNVVRYFGPNGIITTIAGGGTICANSIDAIGDGCSAQQSTLNVPKAVSVDVNGNVYVADTGNDVIRTFSSFNGVASMISIFAGTQGSSTNSGDGGVSASATLNAPSDVALDAAGDVYIAAGGQVRMVNAAGTISTIAGTGAAGSYSGDGGLISSMVIPSPASNVIVDGDGNLYISATAANRVLKAKLGTPSSVVFGNQPPTTTSAPQTVTLLNTGNSALTLSGISTAVSEFALDNSATTACTASTTLAPGASCTLTVTFTPSSTDKGAISGTLTIADNSLNNGSATQTITLTGTAKQVLSTTTMVSVSPSSLAYGGSTSATITATVNGSSPTGLVNFLVNGTQIGNATLTGNLATYPLPVLNAVGTDTITASYAGDGNNASSSGMTSITIQPAVLTVTATNATVANGAPIPAFAYTVSGFVNGDTASVLSGTPAETTTATSTTTAGTFPITISQGTLTAANYIFTFVNGTLTVQPPPPPDFTLSISPTSLTIPSGRVGVSFITLTPLYGYTGTVQISCTSAPQGVGCIAGQLVANASGDPSWTQIQFTSSNSLSSKLGNISGTKSDIWMAIELPLGLLGIAFARRTRKRGLEKLFLLVGLTVFVTAMTSCSTGSPATAASDTYQVTITATDKSTNLSHPTTFTLTVE